VAKISYAIVMENIKQSENWLTVSKYHKGKKTKEVLWIENMCRIYNAERETFKS